MLKLWSVSENHLFQRVVATLLICWPCFSYLFGGRGLHDDIVASCA